MHVCMGVYMQVVYLGQTWRSTYGCFLNSSPIYVLWWGLSLALLGWGADEPQDFGISAFLEPRVQMHATLPDFCVGGRDIDQTLALPQQALNRWSHLPSLNSHWTFEDLVCVRHFYFIIITFLYDSSYANMICKNYQF